MRDPKKGSFMNRWTLFTRTWIILSFLLFRTLILRVFTLIASLADDSPVHKTSIYRVLSFAYSPSPIAKRRIITWKRISSSKIELEQLHGMNFSIKIYKQTKQIPSPRLSRQPTEEQTFWVWSNTQTMLYFDSTYHNSSNRYNFPSSECQIIPLLQSIIKRDGPVLKHNQKRSMFYNKPSCVL